MDGQSPEIPQTRPTIENRPTIQAFVTRREAVISLDTENPEWDNRFVADISTGNIFFVKQQYNPDDPKKDMVQHKDIVRQLVAEGKIKSATDARGGYVLVIDPTEGEVMHSGRAGTIDSFAQDEEESKVAFDTFLSSLKEGDPTDPHFFVIDKTYGAPDNTTV